MSTNNNHRRAVIVVDCQNDFCEGGSLAVSGGASVVSRIAEFVNTCDPETIVVATLDSHVDPGSHFSDSPDYVDSWPAHCVVGTVGSQPHPNLHPALGRVDGWFSKGAHEAAYSGFEGRNTTSQETLHEYFSRRRVGSVEVVGIATDYCVAATVRSAHSLGYAVTLRADLCAAVDPSAVPALLAEFVEAGVAIAVE